MKKSFALLLCMALLLASCRGAGPSDPQSPSDRAPENTSGAMPQKDPHEDKSEKPRPPKAEHYAEEDLDYSVNISDGARTVTLDVTRRGGISTASIASPEELAGTVLTDDIEGMRVFPPLNETELTLSPEASAGLAVVFDIMAHTPDKEEFCDSGAFEFDLPPYSVALVIGDNGYPASATVTDGASERKLEFSVRSVD